MNDDFIKAVVGPQAVSQPIENAQTTPCALSWARVSTHGQEERGTSVPEQLRLIRGYAEANGYEVLAEYQEAASGSLERRKRAEFNRMLAHAKSDKRIKAIIVYDFSRFSRVMVDSIVLIEELRKAGIALLSVTEATLDPETTAGLYMGVLTHASNEAYRRAVSQHTRKCCLANVQQRDPETNWCYKNGGKPLFGYRSERLYRGGTPSRPIVKTIWAKDDTIVAGRPVWEWAREALLLAGTGVSLKRLADHMNRHGVPAPRTAHWGFTTWRALLEPQCLLAYSGMGVYNVHIRNTGVVRPLDEWILVENAHPAILTKEEAQHIAVSRQEGAKFPAPPNRSKSSRYLLSGSAFKCGRCGANMVGYVQKYYICASIPNRRGAGCGPGVLVRKDEIEARVIADIQMILDNCADPKGFTRLVNDELAKLSADPFGPGPDVDKEIAEVRSKFDRVYKALEDGLNDAAWANERLKSLKTELSRLEASKRTVRADVPKLSVEAALAYRSRLGEVLAAGNPADRKALVRMMVAEMKMAPETRQIEVIYRVPEAIMVGMVAGVGFEPTTFGL
jgi:DNA invertase Pin-like site-specific DNA recombinase